MEGVGGRLSALSQIMSPLIFFHAADTVYTSIIVFPFSLSFWQEVGGREAQRNPFFSALLYSFFLRRLYCHVLFHTGFCSATRNQERVYHRRVPYHFSCFSSCFCLQVYESFTLSFMSKSKLGLVILKVEPTTFSD